MKQEDGMGQIFGFLPTNVRQCLHHGSNLLEQVEEIRFRIGQPVELRYIKESLFLGGNSQLTRDIQRGYRFTTQDMKEFLDYISNYSLYAYETEMRQGFITLRGGHRVGLAGQPIYTDGAVKTLRNIAFANIRIAREHIGIGESILPYLYEKNTLCSTLIVSPPCCGKTSLLRDLIRCISTGHAGTPGKNVGVVDERSELAACYQGIPQNDIGPKTDVLDGCPKGIGIEMLLRSMSPEVIAVDELGNQKDYEALQKANHCGCVLFATLHGDCSLETYWNDSFDRNNHRKDMLRMFSRMIFLGVTSDNKFLPRVYRATDGAILYGRNT